MKDDKKISVFGERLLSNKNEKGIVDFFYYNLLLTVISVPLD